MCGLVGSCSGQNFSGSLDTLPQVYSSQTPSFLPPFPCPLPWLLLYFPLFLDSPLYPLVLWSPPWLFPASPSLPPLCSLPLMCLQPPLCSPLLQRSSALTSTFALGTSLLFLALLWRHKLHGCDALISVSGKADWSSLPDRSVTLYPGCS